MSFYFILLCFEDGKIKSPVVYFKMMHVSFSKRLLLLFVLCSTLPLFLLSFVFSEISRYVVARNAVKRATEVSENILHLIEKNTKNAVELAELLASDSNTIAWCKGNDDATIVSDLFQNIAKNSNDEIFQVYIVSGSQPSKAISRQSLPQEYKNSIYSDWGILHKAKNLKTSAFFAQPHPKSSPNAVLAFCLPVEEAGFVIIDILREGLEKECSKTEGLTSLQDFFIYDESGCIAFSVQNEYRERAFIQDLDDIEEKIFLEPVAGTPFFACGIIPMATDEPYIRGLQRMVIFTAIIASLIAIIAAALVSRSVAQPVQSLSTAMKTAEGGNLSVRCEEPSNTFQDYDLVLLIRQFNSMVSRIESLTDERVERERLLRVAEIKNLQAQISPHFLYNTLNSIKSIAKFAHSPEIVKIVTNLGKLLRESIISENGFYTDYYSIEKSLELVRNYFDIEAIRWENKFDFVEEVDSEILSYPIPRLVLQPVVENALVHGLEEKAGKGRLTIKGFFETNTQGKLDIVIIVQDDGQGMSEEKLQALRKKLSSNIPDKNKIDLNKDELGSNGIALVNTNTRLKLLYGQEYGLSIDSKLGKGTSVTIRLKEEV